MSKENSGQPMLADSSVIKQHQVWIVGGVLFLIAIGILWAVYYGDPSRKMKQAAAQGQLEIGQKFKPPSQAVDPQKAFIARAETAQEDFNARLAALESTMNEREAAYQSRITELETQLGEIPTDFGESDADQASPALSILPPLPGSPPPVKAPPVPETVKSETNKRPSLSVMPQTKAKKPKIIKTTFKARPKDDNRQYIETTIPVGTFVEAILLNGLDAPTGGLAESNPHPVQMVLVDHGNMPNNYVHRIKECRVLAAGYGELSDERAYMRAEHFSCVLLDGSIISKQMKGYVVGEDGKNGVAGTLISKEGALVGRALLAGLFSGIGSAVGESYSTLSTSALGAVSSVRPEDIGRAGLAQGASTALEKVSDWYLKRADEIFPVVEVEAGRMVTLFFTEDVELELDMFAEHTP